MCINCKRTGACIADDSETADVVCELCGGCMNGTPTIQDMPEIPEGL